MALTSCPEGGIVKKAVRVMLAAAALPLAAFLSGSAFAQVDLSGAWQPVFDEDQPERIPGPELVDYLGLPLNAAARQWALSWDPDRLTLQEHQCQVHTVAYIYRGPLLLRIWEVRDPETQQVVALRNYISTYEQNRTIWMNGHEPPPPYAAHTWMGFSTGKWEGNILTVHTVDVKQGWHRRNGLPSSDLITLTEHFIRHGNHLTHVSIVTDPVYLTEPLIKTQDYVKMSDSAGNWLWPCEYVDEVPGRPQGVVPSYAPGENPFETEFAARHHIPLDAALGGAKTAYPEYRQQMQGMPIPKMPAAAKGVSQQ
jgi:hypothetical protein